MLSIGGDDRRLMADMAVKEISTLNMLKGCPHILQIKGAVQTKNNIYLVTEFCREGTLSAYLSKHGPL